MQCLTDRELSCLLVALVSLGFTVFKFMGKLYSHVSKPCAKNMRWIINMAESRAQPNCAKAHEQPRDTFHKYIYSSTVCF